MNIAIIGGGIVGASAAYHLVKLKHQVTLIDDQNPGQATEHAAGIICPWLARRRNQAWYELVKQSAAFYKALVDELQSATRLEIGYKENGSLFLRDNVEKMDELEKLAHERKKDAPEMGTIRRLKKEEIPSYFPLLKPDYEALFISGGGRVKGSYLRKALLSGAKNLGLNCITAKASLKREGKRIIVRAEGSEAAYDNVILAAGAWLKPLARQLGYEADLFPQKGQLLRFKYDSLKTDHLPTVLLPASKNIVPFSNGEIIVGATHEKKEKFSLVPTRLAYEEIISKAGPYMPSLRENKNYQFSVGTRPYTSDFSPFIGEVEPGLFVANGLGASGLSAGPYVGKIVAELIEGKTPSLDLTRFDPARYMKRE